MNMKPRKIQKQEKTEGYFGYEIGKEQHKEERKKGETKNRRKNGGLKEGK